MEALLKVMTETNESFLLPSTGTNTLPLYGHPGKDTGNGGGAGGGGHALPLSPSHGDAKLLPGISSLPSFHSVNSSVSSTPSSTTPSDQVSQMQPQQQPQQPQQQQQQQPQLPQPQLQQHTPFPPAPIIQVPPRHQPCVPLPQYHSYNNLHHTYPIPPPAVSHLSTGEAPKKNKPGRKCTTEEPANKRIAQNRLAQKTHRERKAMFIAGLEQQVAHLNSLLASSRQEVAGLVLHVEQLRNENVALREMQCVRSCWRQKKEGEEGALCDGCKRGESGRVEISRSLSGTSAPSFGISESDASVSVNGGGGFVKGEGKVDGLNE